MSSLLLSGQKIRAEKSLQDGSLLGIINLGKLFLSGKYSSSFEPNLNVINLFLPAWEWEDKVHNWILDLIWNIGLKPVVKQIENLSWVLLFELGWQVATDNCINDREDIGDSLLYCFRGDRFQNHVQELNWAELSFSHLVPDMSPDESSSGGVWNLGQVSLESIERSLIKQNLGIGMSIVINDDSFNWSFEINSDFG